MPTEKFLKEYKEVEELIIDELKALPRGGIPKMSREHKLPVNELYRFKNRKLKTTRPFFMKKLLEALGYTNVEIVTTVHYRYEKKRDS